MYETVKELLAKQLRVEADTIRPDSDIKSELRADSLDILELLMAIEQDYGITIPDEELAAFHTVQDIADYLDAQKNA